MKQFENLDSVMELVNHSKNTANLKKLLNRGKFLLIIVALLAFSSCSRQLYLIKPVSKQDEISISPELRQFLNNNKQQVSVVLRTPRTTSNVTQEVQNSELYNTIERRLMNAGFIVRDRALLEKLIVNEQLSYENIAQKIKVDLIIEVVENSRYDNSSTKMFRAKNNEEVHLSTRDKLNVITSKFTFRIVLAEAGISSGFFTFYYMPCTNGCGIYAQKTMGTYFFGKSKKEVKRRFWGSPQTNWSVPFEYSWWVEGDFISNDLSIKIINILQGR
jgi:hypothetical protein